MIATEWEYDIITLPATPYKAKCDVLNARGADGWEAVGVLGPYEVVVKRPVAQFVTDAYVTRAPKPQAERTV